MRIFAAWRLPLITAGLFLLLVAWDVSGLDLALAHALGGPAGFPLRDNWFLSEIAHDAARRIAWALAFYLCLMVWWPIGRLTDLDFNRRLQLAVTTLIAVFTVSFIKTLSATSCPWSLSDFGGIAHRMAHWTHLLQADGGSGHCFPAGHASSGFAFLGGYFAFRHQSPGLARAWLYGAIALGLLLGLAQQLRGAHFMSHTLWALWICWVVAWAIDAVWFGPLARGQKPTPGELV